MRRCALLVLVVASLALADGQLMGGGWRTNQMRSNTVPAGSAGAETSSWWDKMPCWGRNDAKSVQDKDECQICEDLVDSTREQLKEHAGDAKAAMLAACDKAPQILHDGCVKVAESAGDAIQKALEQAYDTLTPEVICAPMCGAARPGPPGGWAGMWAYCQRTMAGFVSGVAPPPPRPGVAGPFDVLCDTCKSSVESAKQWIKEHQTDVRQFMYDQCDAMAAKGVDPAKCKETADKVADRVEATLQKIYDSIDADAVCSTFCPPPPPPRSGGPLQGLASLFARRFFGGAEAEQA